MNGRLTVVAALFFFGVGSLFFQPWNTLLGLASDRAEQPLSTPERIEQARLQELISPETANLYLAYALLDSQELPKEYISSIPWDGTLVLLQLQNDIRARHLNSQTTETIQALLSSICSYSANPLPNRFLSDHFFIEYASFGGDLGLNDYVNSLEASWMKQVEQFEWAAPPVFQPNPAPGNRYPVRVTSLNPGLYGFVSTSGDNAGLVGDNQDTSWNEGDAYASCMVLNQDYTDFPGSPLTALDATAAHEFNHAIQYGLGALHGHNIPDPVFIEGGATWMEDETFDEANDNYNYLWPFFSSCMSNYNRSPYPYWITFRGMLEPFGTGLPEGGEEVMQLFWELTSQNLDGNLGALNRAFERQGTTLADVFHNYAIAVKFNRPCQAGYKRPYCLEEGPEYIAAAGSTPVHGAISSVGSNFSGSVQDNFAINWVRLPENQGTYSVTLRNTSSGGALRSSVVCDMGSTLRVQAMDEIASPNTEVSGADFNSNGCDSVVVVVTNQAMTAENPSICTARSFQLLTSSRITPTPTPLLIYYFPFMPN
ncbi:MAG TPA: hypothetical protein VN363_00075 [Anaerolineales bacterium]|nr:hypothetical protein [Anaerolineales bacterium]